VTEPRRTADRETLAHDLKAPLAVISGYAELLRVRDDETTRRDAPLRILEAAERLSGQIDRLLDHLDGRDAQPAEPGRPLRRIVLVDDDRALRGLLRATLPEDEYEVVEAGDTRAAVAEIDGDVDLVVLDWLLPDGTGGDVLAEVKARRPDLPVIVLTAEADAPADAADAFLTKPFSPIELLDLVERLLGRD
jgi:CheY-like chemotaxis protein